MFDTGSSELARLTSSGNFGVGTNNPTSKIDIHCGSDNTGLQITSTDAGAFASYFDNTGASTIGHQGTDLVLSCDPAGSVSSSNIVFQVDSNSEKARISAAGNFGIGDRTTSPDELLHVHTASGEAKIHVEAATNARVRIRAHSGESIVQFADAASSNPGEVNYAHSSNSMSFRTNGNARVTINSDGIMTKTHHPSFSAHTTNTTSANTDVVFNATVTNIGSHYSTSNGRFTAPVAGNYYFGFYGMSPHADSTNIRCYFKINGAAHSSGQMYGGVGYAGGTPSNGYTHISMETILPLSANDYVNVYWQNTSMHSEHCKFNGFLIG